MKFKVGDRVKIIGNYSHRIRCNIWENLKGAVHTVTADVTNESDYGDYKLDDGYGFIYFDEMLEPAPFGKSDLQSGMRVRYRNGKERIVLKNDDEMVFTSRSGMFCDGSDYAEDLTMLDGMEELDIVEILRPEHLNEALTEDCDLISIWKREEEPIEITIAEIADWKGVSPERIRIKED